MALRELVGKLELKNVADMSKLKMVYFYVSLSILSATLGLLIGLPFASYISLWVFILLFIIEIGTLIYFMYNKNVYTLSLFAFLSGVVLIPLINTLITVGLTYIIFQALLGTGVIVALLTYYAFTTKNNYIKFSNILFYVLIAIIIVSIINIFLGNSVLHLIISIASMVLFSFFIIIDTQEALYTDIEPLDAACSLYIDILNLFVSLLNILSFFEKD